MSVSHAVLAASAVLALITFRTGAHAQPTVAAEVSKFEADFSSALTRNDVALLARDLSDDWEVIGADGHAIAKARFLEVIASGDLKHDKMLSQDQSVRLYGDTAVVTARLLTFGSYKGAAFRSDEIGTDVIARMGGRWVCVLTQLTTNAGQ